MLFSPTSKQVIKSIILSGVLLILYWSIKQFLPSQVWYMLSVQNFSNFAAKFVELMANNIYGISTTYNPENQTISTPDLSFNIVSSLGLKFYLIALIIVVIKPVKLLKTFLCLILAWILLFTISIAKFSIDINNAPYKDFYLALIYTSRYLVLYLLVIYKINLHEKVQALIKKTDHILSDKLELNFLNLLLFFILSKPVLSFVDVVLTNQIWSLRENLTQLILWIAEIILKIAGYSEATVDGYQVVMGNYWVYLGAPCIGVGVMLLFAAIIFLIKSNIPNKVIFTVTGWAIILIMNAFRIVCILLYIFLKQLPQKEIMDFHNMSNNFFYLIILLLIIIYVRWFQNIRFGNNKISN